MKKVSMILALVILSTTILMGCSDGARTDGKIPKSMTGLEDFNNKLDSGDRVILIYGTDGEKGVTQHSKIVAGRYGNSIKNSIVKSDKEVTEEDIKENHIILFGNPATSKFFVNINEYLPIKIQENKVIIGNNVIEDNKIIYRYVVPNPLNKKKYLYVMGAVNNDNLFACDSIYHSSKDDYMILVNENERYCGDFTKTDEEWTINDFEENTFQLDSFKIKESEHFNFHYSQHDSSVEDNIDKIIEERETAYKLISEKLNIDYNSKIDYYFFINRELMKRSRASFSYYWLGQIYDIYDGDNEEKDYIYEIYRNLIHQKGTPLNSFTMKALYQSFNLESKHSDESVKEIINSEKYIPLDNLSGYSIDRKMNKKIVNAELYSFGKYLIEQYGFDKYMEYYKENLTEFMDDALYNIYGKDLIELEEQWLKQIQ